MASLNERQAAWATRLSIKIETLRFDRSVISCATGFLVLHDGIVLLLTNNHVLSGKNYYTGQRSQEWPQFIRVWHLAKHLCKFDARVYPLYKDPAAFLDELWLEHADADIAALPISKQGLWEDAVVKPFELDTLNGGKGPCKLTVFDHLSIVGFPFARPGTGAQPVWIRGWVSSEPDFELNGNMFMDLTGIPQRDLPAFLIDARTREGMSGSPVWQHFKHDNGTFNINFVGIYSGRVNEHSDLGFVWKAGCTKEFIKRSVSQIRSNPAMVITKS